ncbi:MAG: ComEC/Rec2 family competence protein [Patescibacteria group bacterium]
MPLPEKFFFGSCFFLLGVLCGSISFGIFTIIITGALALVSLFLFFGLKKKTYLSLFFLLFLLPVGSFYYTLRSEIMLRVSPNSIIDADVVVAQDVRVLENSQEAVVDVLNERGEKVGRVLLRLRKFPEVHYGDFLRIKGRAEYPSERGYAGYLEKDGISGIIAFPDVIFLGENKGSKILETLFNIKNFAIHSFEKVLPPKESAFLSGVVLGDTSGFSKEFKTALSQSGTSHLVALSGYNITILVSTIMTMCGIFFSRRSARWIAGVCIFGFVIMTGGQASVVRAAIMGCVLLFVGARKTKDPRNLLICTALLMVLWNPKILTFDVGFQLSFFALLGIVYLRPAFQKLFHFSNNPGLFLWRENLLSTTAAQCAVLPILISSFGGVSATSLIANVCILGLIPVTMGLGFSVIFSSIFSFYISLVFGWITWIFLKFEIGIIEFFAGIAQPLTISMNIYIALVYYSILLFFVLQMNKRGLSHQDAQE